MRASEVWKTTSFRLSILFGLLFVCSTTALLATVDLRVTSYLDRRADRIIDAEAAALMRTPRERLQREIVGALAVNGGVNVFAVFSPDRRPLAGDLAAWPAALRAGGSAIEVAPTAAFPGYARLRAFPMAAGETLVVGRNVTLTRELRAIIASALAWSGVSIVVIGLALGLALSAHPMRRLQLMQRIAEDIAGGDLKRRMPVSRRRDELDTVAASVNVMVGEIERLMGEVKAATDTVAHDLRTPLTHMRARLHRLQSTSAHDDLELRRLVLDLDEVLERFRALMRLSELESPARHSGFAQVALCELLQQAVELYRPVADEQGATIACVALRRFTVRADRTLLFEAVTNLLDNALKFSAAARVRVAVDLVDEAPALIVEDSGPGIAPTERQAVLNRFYRSEAARLLPGSGLGLSVVVAITRLHGFELRLEDAHPGLRAIIRCGPPVGPSEPRASNPSVQFSEARP